MGVVKLVKFVNDFFNIKVKISQIPNGKMKFYSLCMINAPKSLLREHKSRLNIYQCNTTIMLLE